MAACGSAESLAIHRATVDRARGCSDVYSVGVAELEAGQTSFQFIAWGGMALREFRTALTVVEGAYNGLVAIDRAIEGALDHTKRFGLQPALLNNLSPLLLSPSFDSSMLVPPGDRLVFGSARVGSAGLVEVIGALNPLKQLREYLNDRHERKKDTAYRNAAEERRLQLENELLLNKVLNERVQLLREVGLPDHQITLILNELVLKPLEELCRAQDAGILELPPGEENAA